jgi:hypothetical protein
MQRSEKVLILTAKKKLKSALYIYLSLSNFQLLTKFCCLLHHLRHFPVNIFDSGGERQLLEIVAQNMASLGSSSNLCFLLLLSTGFLFGLTL